jgi:hypothetical protein
MSPELCCYSHRIGCEWYDRHEDHDIIDISIEYMQATLIYKYEKCYESWPAEELREKCQRYKSEIYTLPRCASEPHTDDHHTEYCIDSLKLSDHSSHSAWEIETTHVAYESEEKCINSREFQYLHHTLSRREIPLGSQIKPKSILIEDNAEYR